MCANSFFEWPRGAPSPTRIDPHELRHSGPVHLRYFHGILAEADRVVEDTKLLLSWNLDKFDDQFQDAVVLLVDDEMYQTPSWAPKARMIFKTGGLRRNSVRETMELPAAVAARVLMRDARNVALSARRRAATPGFLDERAPMYEVPLGYCALVDVPYVPFTARPADVFFAGSVGSPRRFTLRPRTVARRQMAAGLARARQELPSVAVDYLTFEVFGTDPDLLAPEQYSRRLMNSRIVLCPRGNFDETMRLFEAAKSGCVVITEHLPSRWYYETAPCVQLRNWAELPATLRSLLADDAALADLADRTRAWWKERVAEAPIAEFIAERLAQEPRVESGWATGTIRA